MRVVTPDWRFLIVLFGHVVFEVGEGEGGFDDGCGSVGVRLAVL